MTTKRDLCKFDLRLLARHSDGKWHFDDGRSLRPSNLERAGLLMSRLSKSGTREQVAYQIAYQITAKGLEALAGTQS